MKITSDKITSKRKKHFADKWKNCKFEVKMLYGNIWGLPYIGMKQRKDGWWEKVKKHG